MYLLLAVFVIIAIGMFLLNRRNRNRAEYQESRLRENITFGTEVMTTSGLYGTVVGVNDDDTVKLAIAPGVEVKWAVAALRDVASLPPRYQRPITGEADPSEYPDSDRPSGDDSDPRSGDS